MKTVLLLTMLAGCAGAQNNDRAQNSDLGLLLGISGPTSSVDLGTGARISGSVGAHGQINYAFQLRETSAGRLYLELPLLFGGHATGTVAGAVTGESGGMVFFTPGVRFNVAPHSRVSFYVAGGLGPVAFDESKTVVGNGLVSSDIRWTIAGAIDFGGGLDFRLTRLMSLRAEARDFVVSGKHLGGQDGYNHPIFGFGVGFHF
jgi:opacity protein-like surface antigen